MYAYRRTRGKIKGRIAELPPELADKTAGAEEQTVAKQLRRLLHEELLPQVELDLWTVVIAHDLDELNGEQRATQKAERGATSLRRRPSSLPSRQP